MIIEKCEKNIVKLMQSSLRSEPNVLKICAVIVLKNDCGFEDCISLRTRASVGYNGFYKKYKNKNYKSFTIFSGYLNTICFSGWVAFYIGNFYTKCRAVRQA